MRSEECDWKVYHIITGLKGCSEGDIWKQSGFSQDIVSESINRLIQNMLIIRRGDQYRACSIEEFMISNQMKHDPFSQIIIENGVVKMKDPDNQDRESTGQDEKR